MIRGGLPGRIGKVRRVRRRWWLAGPVVVVLAAAVVVLGTRGPGSGSTGANVTTSPALVGRIMLDPAAAQPGAPVIATIAIRADRSMSVDALVLSVRDARGKSADAAGRDYDFPDAGPVRLGPKARTVTVGHEFPTRGTYSYFLRYRIDTRWHTLPPYNTFTVG